MERKKDGYDVAPRQILTTPQDGEPTPTSSIQEGELEGILTALAPTEIGDTSLHGEDDEEMEPCKSNVLEDLTQRSLRAQCAKVVMQRPALAPFRSSK